MHAVCCGTPRDYALLTPACPGLTVSCRVRSLCHHRYLCRLDEEAADVQAALTAFPRVSQLTLAAKSPSVDDEERVGQPTMQAILSSPPAVAGTLELLRLDHVSLDNTAAAELASSSSVRRVEVLTTNWDPTELEQVALAGKQVRRGCPLRCCKRQLPCCMPRLAVHITYTPHSRVHLICDACHVYEGMCELELTQFLVHSRTFAVKGDGLFCGPGGIFELPRAQLE